MVHAVVIWSTLIFMVVKFSKLFEHFIAYIFLPVDKLEPFFLSDIHIYSIVPLPHIDILILAVCRIIICPMNLV